MKITTETKCKNCGHRFGVHGAFSESCPNTDEPNPDPAVKMFGFKKDSSFQPAGIPDSKAFETAPAT